MRARQDLGEQWPSADLERRYRAGDHAVMPEHIGQARAREIRRALTTDDQAREAQRAAALAELRQEVAAYPSPVAELLALAEVARNTFDVMVDPMAVIERVAVDVKTTRGLIGTTVHVPEDHPAVDRALAGLDRIAR